MDENQDTSRKPRDWFVSTRWTVIRNAGTAQSTRQLEALSQLCSIYWYPVYVYVRKQGTNVHDAQDVTQGFFAHLLSTRLIDRADRNRGQFRWFLIGALKRFLSDERDRRQALKRGGGRVPISLDAIQAEDRFGMEPGCDRSPEKQFDRSWAMTLLARVQDQLRDQYRAAGKSDRFEHLKRFLPGENKEPYSQAANALGLSEGALRVELSRMRAAFRKLLRTEIGHPVSTPTEIDEELRYLIDILR